MEEKPSTLQVVVAILVAVATVIGALIAWQSSVVSNQAGDADGAGMKAVLAGEETRALSAVNAYEHYGAFSNYARYQALGDLLGQELQLSSPSDDQADESQTAALLRQQAEAYDLAKANQSLFPSRFLNRDGTYAVEREMSERWADAAREKELEPDANYAEAERARSVSTRLLLSLSVLSVSLVCFSLVETFDGLVKKIMVALGGVFMVVGAVMAILAGIK